MPADYRALPHAADMVPAILEGRQLPELTGDALMPSNRRTAPADILDFQRGPPQTRSLRKGLKSARRLTLPVRGWGSCSSDPLHRHCAFTKLHESFEVASLQASLVGICSPRASHPC